MNDLDQLYQPDPIHQAAKEACCKFLLGQPLNEHDRDALRMEVFIADNETLELF